MKRHKFYAPYYVWFNVFLRLALIGCPVLVSSVATAKNSGDPDGCEIKEVKPSDFGAGSVILIKGSGFEHGDTVLLKKTTLENVNITPNAITATIPEKTKSGTEIVIKRGKKKVAKSKEFFFVKQPKVSKTKPSYGIPGQTIQVSGTELDRVGELKVGDIKISIIEKTKKKLTFTIPNGLKSGTLAVSGIGGTAQLKKEFEVFYPPEIKGIEPLSGFDGDTVTVKGNNLDSKGGKFFLGKKSIKPISLSASTLVFSVPKKAKSGSISAKARTAKHVFDKEFTVWNRPVLKVVPKEAGVPGTVLIKGKYLDEVEKWKFGSTYVATDANYKKNSSKAVQLVLPGTLSGEHSVKAISHGAETESKRPLRVVATPQIKAARFIVAPDGKKTELTIYGAEFDRKSKFFLGTKQIKPSKLSATEVTISLPKPLKRKLQNLRCQTSKYKSEVFVFDGSADGYTYAYKDILAHLRGQSLTSRDWNYGEDGVRSDLAHINANLGSSSSEYAHFGKTVTSNQDSRILFAEVCKNLSRNLVRLISAQEAICTAMKPEKSASEDNAKLGRLLEEITSKQKRLVVDVLTPLWGNLPVSALESPSTVTQLDMGLVDEIFAESAIYRKPASSACAGKYYGRRVLASAEKAVSEDLKDEYKTALMGAISGIVANKSFTSTQEKKLDTALSSFSSSRRGQWKKEIKAHFQTTKKKSSKKTGKGAGRNRTAEKTKKKKPTK